MIFTCAIAMYLILGPMVKVYTIMVQFFGSVQFPSQRYGSTDSNILLFVHQPAGSQIFSDIPTPTAQGVAL